MSILPTIQINDVSLDQLTYRDVPVVTFQQIADVHGIPVQNVYRSFKRHEQRFTPEKHFYLIDNEGVYLEYNDTFRTNYLFTEKGYLLLTKPMRDQKSWEVQERMIDDYFSLKTLQPLESQSPWDVMATLVAMGKAHEQKMLALEAEQKRQLLSIIETQARTIEAHELATRALEAQLWMTLRQYRFVHGLEHQLSDLDLSAFGKFLTGYCGERGIPIALEAVADARWGKENKYHVPTIATILPSWLHRRHGQAVLRDEAN